MSARILVTGARLPAALEIVRALAADGHEVWAGDSLRFTPAGASRHAAGALRFPAPALDPAGFRESVVREVRRLGIDLVLPVSEEIFALARLREALPARTTLFAPSFAQLRALHSKWQILELAADCGIGLPRTVRVTTLDELRAVCARHPGWILKPEFSRGGYQAHASLPTNDGLRHRLPWLVQETIAGREISAFAIAQAGRVLASSVYLPCYRLGRGASVCFDPVRSDAARAFLERFIAKHALTGQFGFDFIEHADGALHLLECNPRATSGVHLLGDAGHWARAYVGGSPDAATPARPCAAKLAMLTLHGPRAVWRGEWRRLRADLVRSRDSCARRGDMRPAWMLPLTSLEIALRSLAWPVPASQAYTFDLEWNGDET